MQYSDAVSILRGVPLFANLDRSKLKLLAFSSTYLTFEKGEALFVVGDRADSAFIIEEGEVEILVQGDAGEIRVGTLGRHELFGELAVFLNAPRSATIRAIDALTVLKIDADVFIRMVTENAGAALGVMQILSDKLLRATQSFERAEDRVRELESLAGPADPAR